MKYEPNSIHKDVPQYLSVCCLNLEFLVPQNVCLLAVTGKLVIALAEENYFDFQTHLISQSADCATHLVNWVSKAGPSTPAPVFPEKRKQSLPLICRLVLLGHPPFAARVLGLLTTYNHPWKRQ